MKWYKNRCIAMLMAVALSIGVFGCANEPTGKPLDAVLSDVGKMLVTENTSPMPGSVGGEWSVLGLARWEKDVDETWFQQYYGALEQSQKKNDGVLDSRKYTEYSRAIIAVTAMNRDPKAVAGYDLLLPLANYEQVCWQGNNGPIWALIALDCGKWEIPEDPSVAVQASRQMYLEKILSAQQASGGWGLADKQPADVDITAMALQALAGYTDQQAVSAAIERGLAWLAAQERHTCESVAQVLVALGELGISLEDERFEGLTDELLGFYRDGQGFVHEQADSESNYMSTEQAFYAMVSATRQAEGKSSLYSMR